ncbi:bromodomain-containing protein [Rhizophagus clarus]|uniref:Bromodomain-containing protein n=1 Tax=Rhizophagus clarus TaxID=94130 RepID=A0A8H3QWS8_9GLOM|nr:bromodomain-containing protein [Rhizophagus clarus]
MNYIKMNSHEEYPEQNILISYLKKNKQPSFYGFLISHRDIIFSSITTSNLKNLNGLWFSRFLLGVENFPDLKTKIIKERSRYAKPLEIFWQEIIKEYKENLVPTITDKIPTTKDSSNANINLITNFCYNILHELESKSNINPFYKLTEKNNKFIKKPMDIFTISSKLDNDEYTNIEEFEKDMHLIFHNCYTYNNTDSKIYHLGKELESVFIEIWTEKTQKKELIIKMQDNNINSSITNKTKVLTGKNINQQKVELKEYEMKMLIYLLVNHMAKQIRILEQNKDDLVFNDVINNALYATLAYKNLVAGNIIPFIKNLKTSLLSRSQMSLFSMNEHVLQAIVEGLLP